ncbi:MAG: ABC transporter substrate-binding protein [Thermoproteota archaeon]
MRRAYKVLTALAVLGILLAPFIPIEASAQQGLKVEAATYDQWLKGRECKTYGGTLKVALPEEPNVFVWFRAGSTWSLLVLDPIYDRLVRFINGTLTYEVAESMEYSPDYMVLTIKIRDGIKWHDGKPLTAEDVAFTINTLAKEKWTYYHGYFASVDHAEAVDKLTVKVYFKEPDAGFIYNALASMRIMPKHIWEPLVKEKGEELTTYMPKIPDELVGSGPFKIVEYVPGQYVRYVANEDYWLGRPCVDELVIVFIKESSVALLAVQKGDVDTYVGWVTGEVVPQLLATEGVDIHLFMSSTFYHWGFNNQRWPFNITEFRRAMAHCVDREAIVREILMGYGMPGSPGVVPPVGVNAQWYNPNVADAFTFNLTKAAEILDKLGFRDVDGDGWREAPNGSDFSFEIYPPSYDIIRVRAAQRIAEWLSQIPGGGIKAEVRVLDWKTVWPLIREGKVDTYLLGSGPGNDISWLYRRFHSWPGGTGNWARFSDPEVDRLTEQLKTTFDPQKRKEIAWRIQEILAEKVPIVVLYYRKFVNPYRTDKLTGWFKPADDDVFNRLTILRVQKKVEAAPTTVVQTVTTVVTTTVAPSGETVTVTQTQTVPVTTTAPAGVNTAVIGAAIAVIIVVIVAAIALRRR